MQILFMCTANSCRSVLSEALFNHMAPEGFSAVSSGSFPSGKLNPHALATLARMGVSTEGLYSKGSDSFADNPPDIVITVCDNANNEPCPIYFGPALKAHWGLVDPANVTGTDAEIQAAFDQTVAIIQARFKAFFALNHVEMTREEWLGALDRMGNE